MSQKPIELCSIIQLFNVFNVQLSRDLGQIRASEPLKLPRLQAPKQNTSNPFPVLSSGEVGWRSGKRECRLEVYGRWGRPKYSIIKQLRWPNDAVPWKQFRKQYSLHFCVVNVLVVTNFSDFQKIYEYLWFLLRVWVWHCLHYFVLTRPWKSAK